jgi:hypothetical protein
MDFKLGFLSAIYCHLFQTGILGIILVYARRSRDFQELQKTADFHLRLGAQAR